MAEPYIIPPEERIDLNDWSAIQPPRPSGGASPIVPMDTEGAQVRQQLANVPANEYVIPESERIQDVPVENIPWWQSLLHPLSRGAPGAAGTLGGAEVGGLIGAGLGTLVPIAGETGVSEAVLGALGDVIGGWIGGWGAEKAYRGLQGEEASAIEDQQLQREAKANPFFAGMGQMLPTVLSANPSRAVGRGLTMDLTQGAKAPWLERVLQNAVSGSRMQGAAAAEQNQGLPEDQQLSIPEQMFRGGVTMAPLGFLPHAEKLLTAVLGHAPSSALLMATANGLYDYGVNGKPFDPLEIAQKTGEDVPGFMLLNGISALFHGPAVAQDPRLKAGQEIAAEPDIPAAAREAVNQTNGRFARWLDEKQNTGLAEWSRAAESGGPEMAAHWNDMMARYSNDPRTAFGTPVDEIVRRHGSRELNDFFQRLTLPTEEEARNATEARKEPESVQPESEGVSEGTNVPEDQSEIREEESLSPESGGGLLREEEIPEVTTPPTIETPPNEPETTTTGTGVPIPSTEGRGEVHAPPVPDVGTLRSLLESRAKSGGAPSIHWHDDANREHFQAFGNERGQLRVAAHRRLPEYLAELPPEQREAELDHIHRILQTENAMRGVKTRRIFDALRLRAKDGDPTAKAILRTGLEMANKAPMDEKGQRSALASLSKKLNQRLPHPIPPAHPLISRLLRMATELRETGTTHEERNGLFKGKPEWRDQTNEALRKLYEGAHDGNFGPSMQALFKANDRVRAGSEGAKLAEPQRHGEVIPGAAPTARDAERAKALALRHLPVNEDQVVLLNSPDDVRHAGEGSPNEATFDEIAQRIEDGESPQGFWLDGKLHVYVPGVEVMAHDASGADSVYHVIVHELFHHGIGFAKDVAPELLNRFHDITSQIADADLDKIAQTYGFADWRDDKTGEARQYLAEEYLANALRGLVEVPREGVLADLIKWLRDLWHRIYGRELPQDPTMRDLSDLFDSMVEGLRKEREHEVTSTGEPRFSLRERMRNPFKGNPEKSWEMGGYGARRAGEIGTKGEGGNFGAGTHFTYLGRSELMDEIEQGRRPEQRYNPQVLGRLTGDQKLRESVKKMVPMVRDWLAGRVGADTRPGEKLAVTPENTEKVEKLAMQMIRRQDFAEDFVDEIIKKQRKELGEKYTENDWPVEGDVAGQAAGVLLQHELMDYGKRALADGDRRVYELMEPLANMVYVGARSTVESAARILHARRWLTHNLEGFDATARKLDKARNEAAIRAAGSENAATELAGATEAPETKMEAEKNALNEIQNPTDEEGKAVTNELGKSAAEKQAGIDEDDEKKWWDRVSDQLESRHKDLKKQLDKANKKVEDLEKALKKAEAREAREAKKSASKAKPEDEAKFALGEKSKGQKSAADIRKELEEAKKLVEKVKQLLEESEKRIAAAAKGPKEKNPLKEDFTKQVRNPVGHDEFVKLMSDKHSMSEDLAETLFNQAEKERGDWLKKSRARREAIEKERAEAEAAKTPEEREAEATERSDKVAESIIDEFDKQQTEWVKPDAKKDPIRELAAQAVKDAGRGLNKDWFDEYRPKFEALGVSPEVSETLMHRLWNENQKEIANRDIRERERIDKNGTIRALVRHILTLPKAWRDSPEYRRQAIEEFLTSNGVTEDRAKEIAPWFDSRIDKHLLAAQEKAAIDTARALNVDNPTIEKIRQAVRARMDNPTDPVNDVLKALAAKGGFKELTPDQWQEMARLDQHMSSSTSPWARAEALRKMFRIFEQSRPPKKFLDSVAESYVRNVLSSLSTVALHYTQPFFAQATRAGTAIADLTALAASGDIRKDQIPGAISQTFKNWLGSYRDNYLPAMRESWKNEVYSGKEARKWSDLTSAQREIDESLHAIKTGSPGERVKGLAKFINASTDFAHRALLSGVEASGRSLEDFLTRQEAMKELLKKGGGHGDVTAYTSIAEKASADGDAATRAALAEDPTNHDRALLIGRDAMLESLRTGTEAMTGKTGLAESIRELTGQERRVELGLRNVEQGHRADLFHFMADLATNTAQYARRQNPLLGRMLTGFISVPAKLIDRSLYFTPYGLGRAILKSRELGRGDNKLYLETMGNSQQLRQRYLEASIGTAALGALLPLIYNQDQDDPHYTGFRFTLMGPKNKALNDVWKKQGHRPGSIEWVQNGVVRAALNYSRGGPESLKSALVTLGTLDDMRLNGTLKDGNVIGNASEFVKELLSGGLKQSSFFGLKNIAEIPKLTDESDKQATANLAYFGSGLIPWSGFVRSLAKLSTGPTDQTDVTGALVAQAPYASFFAKPAMNFLGDQAGEAPQDPFTQASDRLAYAGLPIYLGFSPQSADADLYNLMAQKKEVPAAPNRATLARRNGLISDDEWRGFVQTRGEFIKNQMAQRYGQLLRAEGPEYDKLIKQIDADATARAKRAMRLK